MPASIVHSAWPLTHIQACDYVYIMQGMEHRLQLIAMLYMNVCCIHFRSRLWLKCVVVIQCYTTNFKDSNSDTAFRSSVVVSWWWSTNSCAKMLSDGQGLNLRSTSSWQRCWPLQLNLATTPRPSTHHDANTTTTIKSII